MSTQEKQRLTAHARLWVNRALDALGWHDLTGPMEIEAVNRIDGKVNRWKLVAGNVIARETQWWTHYPTDIQCLIEALDPVQHRELIDDAIYNLDLMQTQDRVPCR
ncbi:MAG: hypothetical protein H6742_15330 [Alphaproteobacteria bacterium]|nr:hypothetical protein [Alphaproteobacteria bacterium]